MSVRFSEDEAWDVIEGSHTGILTTLKQDGSPVTLPVWFVVLDRTICMRTPARTKKIKRVRRDARASFLVESGERWAELEAVHLSGHLAFTMKLAAIATAEFDPKAFAARGSETAARQRSDG